MRYLPDETLRHIFFLCLPHYRRPLYTFEAPLLLYRVCSDWRRIMLASSEMWSSIYISTFRSVASLEERISRSRERPLSITLDRNSEEGDLVGNDMLAAMDLLVKITGSHRLKEVSLFAYNDFLAYALLFIREHMPLIESLNMISDKLGRWHVDVGDDLPHLRRVDLGNHDVSTIDLPWGQLTHMELAGTMSGLLEKLPLCTNAVQLDFFVNDDSRNLVSRELIVLNQLQKFVIDGYNPLQEVSTLLSVLVLPALN